MRIRGVTTSRAPRRPPPKPTSSATSSSRWANRSTFVAKERARRWANTRGSFGSLENVDISSGDVTVARDDAALSACLHTDKYDVVYLTNKLMSAADVKSQILHCPNGPKDLCDNPNLEHLGLNLIRSSIRGGHDSVRRGIARHGNSLVWLFVGIDGLVAAARSDGGPTSSREAGVRHNRTGHDEPKSGDWSLTVDGRVYMDSRATNQWPGCRRPGAGLCPPSIQAGAFDQIFRRGSGQLGSAEGDPEQEAALIGWRVQGAVWLLGSLSSEVRPGLIYPIIPVADFTAPGTAPFPTVYGNGVLTATGAGTFKLADEDAKDGTALGVLRPDPGTSSVAVLFPNSDEVPEWLRTLQNNRGHYKYTVVSNEAVPTNAPDAAADPTAWFGGRLSEIDGVRCTDGANVKFAGEPVTPGDPRLASAVNALGALKGDRVVGRDKAGNPIFKLIDGPQGLQSYLADTWRSMSGTRWVSPSDVIPQFGKDQDQGVENNIRTFGVGNFQTSIQGQECNRGESGLGGTKPGVVSISSFCAVTKNLSPPGAALLTRRMLLPRNSSPRQRAPVFANSYRPAGSCGAAAQVTQGLMLACEILQGQSVSEDTPPDLTKAADIPRLENWVLAKSGQAKKALRGLYLRKVPKTAADNLFNQTVGTGVIEGDHGNAMLDIEGALTEIPKLWIRVTGDFDQVGFLIRDTRHQNHCGKHTDPADPAKHRHRRARDHGAHDGRRFRHLWCREHSCAGESDVR